MLARPEDTGFWGGGGTPAACLLPVPPRLSLCSFSPSFALTMVWALGYVMYTYDPIKTHHHLRAVLLLVLGGHYRRPFTGEKTGPGNRIHAGGSTLSGFGAGTRGHASGRKALGLWKADVLERVNTCVRGTTQGHIRPRKLAVDGMQTGGATTVGPECVSVAVLRSRPVPGSLILKDTEKLVFKIQAFLINQEGFH